MGKGTVCSQQLPFLLPPLVLLPALCSCRLEVLFFLLLLSGWLCFLLSAFVRLLNLVVSTSSLSIQS